MVLCCPICKTKIVFDVEGVRGKCKCVSRDWVTPLAVDELKYNMVLDGFFVVKAVDCKTLNLEEKKGELDG